MKLNSTQVRSENSLKVINKYISVSDKAKNDSGEMYIYGTIADEKWYDDDITPKSILDALEKIGPVKSLDIHINSYGGSCIAGNAIISVLDNYRTKNKTKLNVYIEGIAASMGSGIASVGDKIYMSQNGIYMIHKPWGMAVGNAIELQKQAEVLDLMEDTLVSNYMRKFNGTEDELRQMMQDETWLSANEAKEYGFVDEIVGATKIAASAKGIRIGDQVFENKVADMIKNKYPNIEIEKEKEEKDLPYDESLARFGITQELFDTMNMESDKVMEIVDAVRNSIPSQQPESKEVFMDKATAISKLDCEDITAEEVLNYAKAGMHPVDTTEMSNKAEQFDKIVSAAKETALKNAQKAKGDNYNDERTKKYLSVLTYDEIIAQSAEWENEAKKVLHAGVRVSKEKESYNFNPAVEENTEDYKF